MDRDEYELMKRYITMDIEAVTKEYEEEEWEAVEEADDFDYSMPKVKKPFSYGKMLEGVMEHLEKTGGVEFAILKDPELGRWWSGKVKERERAKKLRDAKDKLISTMSKEELKILGIKI